MKETPIAGNTSDKKQYDVRKWKYGKHAVLIDPPLVFNNETNHLMVI